LIAKQRDEPNHDNNIDTHSLSRNKNGTDDYNFGAWQNMQNDYCRRASSDRINKIINT